MADEMAPPAAEAVRDRLIGHIMTEARRGVWSASRMADAILADPLIGPLLAGSGGVPDGWKLVPIEPTDVMWRAARDAFVRCPGSFTEEQIERACYKAALAAAPAPPAQDKTP